MLKLSYGTFLKTQMTLACTHILEFHITCWNFNILLKYFARTPFGRKIIQFWVDFARYKVCRLFLNGSIRGLKGSKWFFIHLEDAWSHKTGLQTQWKLISRPRYTQIWVLVEITRNEFSPKYGKTTIQF